MADEYLTAAIYGMKRFNEWASKKVKELMGMGKLIELLNEYKKIKGYDGNTKITNYDTDTGSFTNGYSGLEYEIVIGKRYGFIKWLVENEKIDREQKTKEFRLQIELDNGSYGELGGEARLLMLLSISDTPIDFLCEIIKN